MIKNEALLITNDLKMEEHDRNRTCENPQKRITSGQMR